MTEIGFYLMWNAMQTACGTIIVNIRHKTNSQSERNNPEEKKIICNTHAQNAGNRKAFIRQRVTRSAWH